MKEGLIVDHGLSFPMIGRIILSLVLVVPLWACKDRVEKKDENAFRQKVEAYDGDKKLALETIPVTALFDQCPVADCLPTDPTKREENIARCQAVGTLVTAPDGRVFVTGGERCPAYLCSVPALCTQPYTAIEEYRD